MPISFSRNRGMRVGYLGVAACRVFLVGKSYAFSRPPSLPLPLHLRFKLMCAETYHLPKKHPPACTFIHSEDPSYCGNPHTPGATTRTSLQSYNFPPVAPIRIWPTITIPSLKCNRLTPPIRGTDQDRIEYPNLLSIPPVSH